MEKLSTGEFIQPDVLIVQRAITEKGVHAPKIVPEKCGEITVYYQESPFDWEILGKTKDEYCWIDYDGKLRIKFVPDDEHELEYFYDYGELEETLVQSADYQNKRASRDAHKETEPIIKFDSRTNTGLASVAKYSTADGDKEVQGHVLVVECFRSEPEKPPAPKEFQIPDAWG